MRVLLCIVATLLLALLGSARGQYTNGTSPWNATIAFYCNTTYCNQTSTAIAAGGADPGVNNKIWAPLYTCLPFAHPELNCTDHNDNDSRYKSFWVTSCSNTTQNDTVTIALWVGDNCTGNVRQWNVPCGYCFDFLNHSIYVNCSEFRNATSANTSVAASDCPVIATTSPPTTEPPGPGPTTAAPPTTEPQLSSAVTLASSVAAAATTGTGPDTTGRDASGADELAMSGILIAVLAIWMAVN